VPGDRLARAGDGLDLQPPRRSGRGLADGPDGSAGQDLGAAGGQLRVHESPELRVDRGQDLGQLLDLGNGQAPGDQRVDHF